MIKKLKCLYIFGRTILPNLKSKCELHAKDIDRNHFTKDVSDSWSTLRHFINLFLFQWDQRYAGFGKGKVLLLMLIL